MAPIENCTYAKKLVVHVVLGYISYSYKSGVWDKSVVR